MLLRMKASTKRVNRVALLFAIAFGTLVGPATVGASTSQPETLRGWAIIGKDYRVVGATVVFSDGRGRIIKGLRGRTGMNGEFAVVVGDRKLPRNVTAIVYGGYAGGERNLPGRLRGPVPMRGVADGLVYITPVSTLAMALRDEYPGWSRQRAERVARQMIGLDPHYDSLFGPWDDGGAVLEHEDTLVDPILLDADIDADGGFTKWEQDMLRQYRSGDFPRQPYRKKGPRPSERKVPGLAAIGGIGVSVVTEVARSCNPRNVKVPGLGALGAWIQKQGYIEQNPACKISLLEESVSDAALRAAGIRNNLDLVSAQVDEIQRRLVTQSATIANLEQTVADTSYSNAVINFAATPAAIMTVNENTQLMLEWMQTITAPRTAANPAGLGMPISQIVTSSDPRARAAADALADFARNEVFGPSVDTWGNSQVRFTTPGTVLPRNDEAKGLLRFGWESLYANNPHQRDLNPRFNTLVDYYRDLYGLLQIQQIDAWRTRGFTDAEIERLLTPRRDFGLTLESLHRGQPTLDLPRCPDYIVGTIRNTTCLMIGTRLFFATGPASPRGARVNATVCAAPQAANNERQISWNALTPDGRQGGDRINQTVPRCDFLPAPAPWAPPPADRPRTTVAFQRSNGQTGILALTRPAGLRGQGAGNALVVHLVSVDPY